jgi:hypothetical protein
MPLNVIDPYLDLESSSPVWKVSGVPGLRRYSKACRRGSFTRGSRSGRPVANERRVSYVTERERAGMIHARLNRDRR